MTIAFVPESVKIVDDSGNSVNGSPSDAAVTNPASSGSVIALLKGVLTGLGQTADAAWTTGAGSVVALLKAIAGVLLNGPGTTTNFVNAAASTNATVVKASAGRVFGFYFVNLTGAAATFKFYDKATSPTVGTDVPVFSLIIGASGAAQGQFAAIHGFQFVNGISYAITANSTDADATAVGARSVVGPLVWK
jgi:hypothetical protein